MKIRLFLALCVLCWREEVRAEFDNEVKRGVYPFMAIVFYSDETVVDSTGVRFQRAAVLIQPQWLVSSAIELSVLDNVPLGFPRKTLLARTGAVTIDSNYTLYEDADEQEREVIQVVRPNIHNPDEWWLTDISLLQTLLPFKMTSTVGFTTVSTKRNYIDKNCIILVYAKRNKNATEDKVLMQLGVEWLPLSTTASEYCGTHFNKTTMMCAIDSDETKDAVFDPDFCQGNSGGPLVCSNEVIALQTYIENNCKQPHLYQLLASWETFINCGTQGRCNKDQDCNICMTINKDYTESYTEATTTLAPMVTETPSSSVTTTEVTYDETETVPATTTPDTEPPQTEATTETTTGPTNHSREPETRTEAKTKTTTDNATSVNSVSTLVAETETKSWPVERTFASLEESARKMMPTEEVVQKTSVEAQVKTPQIVPRSAGHTTHTLQLISIPLVIMTRLA